MAVSALVAALTALGQQIAASGGTANAAHLATIDAHLVKLDSEEGADEATIADTSAALAALVAAANPTSSASGSSSASGGSTPPASSAKTASKK